MNVLKLIDDFPMFAHCSEEEKKTFCSLKKSLLELKKGDVIIEQGIVEKSFYPLYLLIKGTVVIEKNGYKRPIAALQSGSVFGEMSFLSNRPRHSNVIVEEDALIMKMDGDFFQKVPIMLKDKIKDFLIDLLIKRLDTMNNSYNQMANVARGLKIRKDYGE